MRILKKATVYCLLLLCFFVHSFSFAHGKLITQLKTILAENLADSLTPGAVLLVSSPQIGTLSIAAGFADKATSRPMKKTDNFRLASMSKTFLAVTILKLIEENKLNLSDKIAELLPDHINIDRLPNGKEATIQQLLQMRSGIPNYTDYESYGELIDKMMGKQWKPEDCIALIYDEKANFVPGKSYEYSNTNYLLLQLIVQNLTDHSYAQSIRQQVLNPLHLKASYVETSKEDSNHSLTTHGYALQNDGLKDVTTLNDGFGLGDGGMISTVIDVNFFIQALLKEKTLLTPKSLQAMLTTKDDYGLDIYREKINGEWAWTHNGASSGFAGQYYYFPQRQLSIVLLLNDFDTEIIDAIAAQTHKLFRQTSSLPNSLHPSARLYGLMS